VSWFYLISPTRLFAFRKIAQAGGGVHIVEFSVLPFKNSDIFTADGLNRDFLKTPLSHRIPVGQQLNMIQHDDIDRTAYDEELTHFIAGWMGGKTGNGEEGLISRDDALCNIFCKLARLDKFSRNKHEDSTVSTTRSDRTDFWNGVPIVSLEEKDDSIQEAVSDIMRKKQWIPNFYRIPFFFGIAFSRDCLKIFTLHSNDQYNTVFDVQFVDNLATKWSCIVAVINVARTLIYFQQDEMIIPSTLRFGVWHNRQFKKIRLESNCCEIELGNADLYTRMCEIYTATKRAGVTHMEHLSLIGACFNDAKCRIRLQPVGIQRRPNTEEQMITAIKHIFQCLFELHALGIVHCDIRWGNIIEVFGNWYLIDFEFACRLYEEPLLALRSAETIRSRYVLDQSRPWSPRHDVYQLGMLLTDMQDNVMMMLDLPANLERLRDVILSKDFTYEIVQQMVAEL
jgi:hypothetical protein